METLRQTLREYKWKEEQQLIEKMLHSRLSSLLDSGRQAEVKQKKASDVLDSEYLFQLKQNTKSLRIFSIPQKKLNAVELDFQIPECPGFCQFRNELYLAGGYLLPRYLK